MRAGHTGLDEPFDRLGASSSKGPDTVGQTPNEGGRRHVTRGALASWEIEQGDTVDWRKRYGGTCPCLS